MAAGAASQDLQALISAFDWGKTAAGAMSTWPAALTVTVRLMLASHVPMVMLIGPKGVLVYNDAYSVFAGSRHPDLLGKEVAEGWPEIADLNLSILDHVLSGKTLSLRDQPMTLNRNGVPEDLWLDLDYSPVVDDDGAAIAELVIVRETTTRVNAERALARSEESLSFALAASGMLGLWDWDVTSDRVTSDSRFAIMFGVDPQEAAEGVPIRTTRRRSNPQLMTRSATFPS